MSNINYSTFYVWVEGPDDERFFDATLRSFFEKNYSSVKVIKYASRPKNECQKLLSGIIDADNEYLFFADKDAANCITSKKEELVKNFSDLDMKKTFIIIIEIESWYLAGLGKKHSKYLKIPYMSDTNNITKEHFLKFLGQSKFSSRIDLQSEILKRYAIKIAIQKNASFDYFYNKFL